MTDSVSDDRVSRETSDRLAIFVDLLRRWNDRINLVSSTTITDLDRRHLQDSLQLMRYIKPDARHVVDLGTGGGFPGLVIALSRPDPAMQVTLIEADRRKCAFLRTVLRETATTATVIADRIERVEPQNADIVTARALAPLTTLLGHVRRHAAPSFTALMLKGARWSEEVADAKKSWTFNPTIHKSVTDPKAAILEIGALTDE